MKLVDLMTVASVNHIYIIDKNDEFLYYFIVGVDDINDEATRHLYDCEVLRMKVVSISDLGSAISVKIDYEVL